MGTIEETKKLEIDFGKLLKVREGGRDVVPVAVQNADTLEVILVAYTDEEAFLRSVRERKLILWSTSRSELWEKGATSGETFELKEVYVNCEQNSLLYKVIPRRGGICHTRNRGGEPRNCFYRKLNMDTMDLENLDP